MSYDRAPDFDLRGRDVPRDLFPDGRVRFSLGTTSMKEVKRRRRVLHELRRDQEWEVLRGIQDGHLDVSEVVRRMVQGGTGAVPELRADLETRRTGAVPTWKEESARYLEWYRENRGEQSYRNVKSRLKRVGEQDVGQTLLADLRLPEIRKDQAETAVKAVSRSPGTRHGLRSAGSGLFSWSIDREAERARVEGRAPRWTVNPFSGIQLADRHPRPATATRDQVRDLLAAAQLYQVVYVRVFVQIGLRIMELAHTRLHTDLDPTRWLWRIQPRGPDPRCGCPQCQVTGWSPKTKHGIRTFTVPDGQPELREAIGAYLETHPAEPGDFAFRNPRTDGVWDPTALRADFKELCGTAGVRYGRDVHGGITLHTLRHTCATELIRARERESVVAALLGDTVATIVSTYVHLDEQDLGDGIARGPRYE